MIYVVATAIIAGGAGYALARVIVGSRLKKHMVEASTELAVLRERFTGKEDQLADLAVRFEKTESLLNEKMVQVSELNAAKASLWPMRSFSVK